jgi:hypothetical protein
MRQRMVRPARKVQGLVEDSLGRARTYRPRLTPTSDATFDARMTRIRKACLTVEKGACLMSILMSRRKKI